MTTKKRLYRSNQRIITGVLGGIAEYFNIDPTIVRIIAIVVLFLTHIFPFIIAYFLLSIVIPAKPYDEGTYHTSSHQKRKDVTPDKQDDEWSDF